MKYSFDIVIVNWNSKELLKECIDSVNNAKKSNCTLNKIIIVDNASTDNSLEKLNTEQDNLMVIQNKENLGFAKACNQGAEFANRDFILFLNPDTIIYKNTFVNLFDYIKKNDTQDIAVYGIQLLDDKNIIQKSCFRTPTLLNFIVRSLGLNKINSNLFQSYSMEDWDHNESIYVDQVLGAFFMIKQDIFLKMNGFDERFFVYFEESDLAKRLKKSSYKTVYVMEAKAYHKGGGTSENIKATRLFLNTKSRLIYIFKHHGLIKGFFMLLFTLTIEPITRITYLIIHKNYSEVLESLRGYGRLYLDIINIVKLGVKK